MKINKKSLVLSGHFLTNARISPLLFSPECVCCPRQHLRRPRWNMQTLLRLRAQRQVRHHDLHRESLLHAGGGSPEGGNHGVPGFMTQDRIYSDFTDHEHVTIQSR